jgi:hypothetical protein
MLAKPAKPGGKPRKLLLNARTCLAASSTDPTTWCDHATASAAAAATGFQLGYVLAGDHWFVDIDGALTPSGWSPLAHELCATLRGAAIEVSQSGTGLHIIGSGMPPSGHSNRNIPLHLELYTTERFIALTGRDLVGDSGTDHAAAITAVAAQYFPPRSTAPNAPDVADEGARADWRGPADDADLLRRAMLSRSTAAVFGGGTRASFADLYHADVAVLAAAYPTDPSSQDPYDRSSADAALFQHLAFWTGCDAERMKRLAAGSALRRDKWDREDYIERTVANARRMQRDVLTDPPPPTSPLAAGGMVASVAQPDNGAQAALARSGDALPLPPPDLPEQSPLVVRAIARTGPTYLSGADQRSLFDGCIYIIDPHKVLMPGGRMLTPERFRAVFGGRTFAMDNRNQRTTRNAFEAFTESQLLQHPMVDGTCFRPALPYGAVVESEGRRRANIWWPAQVRRVKGDVTPFLVHLSRVLPVKKDADILLYFMAGVVQFVGYKFQWMPLLIGAEGNGKSLFSRCVAAAVGQRYSHWPRAEQLGKQFNGWVYGKVFAALEDVFIQEQQQQIWEVLKPMITGENIEIESKGIDQRTDEVSFNMIANTNHQNGIRKTENDRRVAHLWTAQQEARHILRDEMGPEYMARLYHWLKNEDGFAIVAEFLYTMPIPPEFGLKWLLGRAPTTSSHEQALVAGMGRVEQEIVEQIEAEQDGFKGGWVSSYYLDLLLTRLGRSSIPPNRRRELMRGLGYDWHPHLPNGRVHNVVLPDASKCKLYIKVGHAACEITAPSDIARAYSIAQGVVFKGSAP